jgi:hypothetical protein
MKTRTPDQILADIASQKIHRDVDLSSRILSTVRRENMKRMKTRTVVISIVIICATIALIFTGPQIVQAMQRLFGYNPGVGMVDNGSSLRILEKPASKIRGETTVTVAQGLVDYETTTLLYQVEHLPEASSGETCARTPELRLPDGTVLQGNVDSGDRWMSGYSRRVQFAALPAEVNDAVLVLPCLEQTSDVPEMQGWEIPLHFVAAPPEMTVYPLVSLPTPTSSPSHGSPNDEANAQSMTIGDLSLSLDQYVQTENDFILFGTIHTSAEGLRIDYVDETDIHLQDASGNAFALSFDPTVAPEVSAPADGKTLQLSYRTIGKPSAGLATLTIDSVWVSQDTDASFSIDLGANPQPGQTWQVNRDLEIAGNTIRITEAKVDQFGTSLTFSFTAPETIGGLNLSDPDHGVVGGSSVPGSASMTYQDSVPSGTITVSVASISLRKDGPWQVKVDLPAFANSGEETEMPTGCLTLDSWKAALNGAQSIPSWMTGTLVMKAISETDGTYHVYVVSLPGGKKEDLGKGFDPAISPNGKTVVYNSENGLVVVDLESKNSSILANTSKRDRGAVFSPDGSKIAFTRGPESGMNNAAGPYSIYISNFDGSEQKPLLENSDANTVFAWMPDGKQLLYSVKNPLGASLRLIDVETGQVTNVIETEYVHSGAVVSPDGKTIAYEDQLNGEEYLIYTAGIDGQGKRLISNTSPFVTVHPQWSPDGKWLAVSVQDTDLSEMNPSIALINVNTCEVLAIPSLTGAITGWIP